jgi:hypothetical protein
VPQLFYKDGSAIPEDKIPEAIATQQAFAKPGTAIAVRDLSTGQLGRIDPSELHNPNYQPLSDAEIDAERIHNERGTAGQKAITAAEGAARGASLGLSDVALTTALGDDYRKGALERREENRKIATVSEVGGAVAPALLTGGESAIAKGAIAAEEGSALARGAGAVAKAVSAPVRAVGAIGGAVERTVAGGLEAAGLAGESVAGRAAAKAVSLGASGAVEGAVFGAGQTLSDSALKGDPLTAEALAAGMGQGALFGGVLGGGIGALTESAPAILGKLLPSEERLNEAATGFARKQLGRDFENAGKSMSIEGADKFKDASASLLLERKLASGENAGKTVMEASSKPIDIADNVATLRSDIGQEIGSIHEKASALIDANPHLAPTGEELIARLEAKAAEFKKQHNTGAYAQERAVKAEIKALRAAIAPPEVNALEGGVENFDYARDGMRDMTNHRGGYAGATPEEAQAIARGEMPTKNSGIKYPDGEEMVGKPFKPVRVHVEADGQIHLNDGRHRLQAAKEAGAKDIAAEIATYDAEGNVLSTEYRNLPISAAPAVEPSFGYDRIRQWQQDLYTQINPKGTPGAMLEMAVKNHAARKAVNDIAADYIKEAAERVFTETGAAEATQLSRLNREYSGALAMEKAARKEAERVLKNRRVSLTDHMLGIGSALSALGSGNAGALSAMALGGAASIGNKIMREQGNAIMAQIARRAAKMSAMVDGAARALSSTGEKIAPSVRLVVEAERPAPYKPESHAALKAGFAEVRDRLIELQNPQHQQAQLAHATGRFQTAYPEVAASLSQQMLRAQAYLASQLPQPAGPPSLSPLARPPTVPPREMQRFLSKVNAVMAPEAVIADIAKGKLDDDAIGAIKEIYPETFGALRSATIQYTAANKEEMPYSRVIHISNVFGFDGDSSMSPARLPGIQQAIQQLNAPPPNQKAPGTPGPTKRASPGTPKLGKPYNLPGQATAGEH